MSSVSSGSGGSGGPARWLEVLDPGPLSTVQDLGRSGLAHLGVPRSGAADAGAHALANRLVGNPAGRATVETTLNGVRLRASTAMAMAVTGAPCEVRVGGRSVSWGQALSVPAGAEVVLGPGAGARCYVAVAGGIEVEEVLGSRSTDLLSGLGPDPLAAGDRLPVGTTYDAPRPVDVVTPRRSDGTVRVRRGPRADWFDPPGRSVGPLEVSPSSNRIGLRLRGESIAWREQRELPSEGMVLGSVQVPPDGQPVVFLADHPTTGGYPVVGVVVPQDLWVCAQARPGDRLTLRLV